MKKLPVCQTCGSCSILMDANVCWDVANNSWVHNSTFDDMRCDECGGGSVGWFEQRETPDPLTVAYLAIGAVAAIKSMAPGGGISEAMSDGGEMHFIKDIIDHALLLDTITDLIAWTAPLDGVYAYDICEPLGFQMAMNKIFGLPSCPEEVARTLLKEASGEEQNTIDMAFECYERLK